MYKNYKISERNQHLVRTYRILYKEYMGRKKKKVNAVNFFLHIGNSVVMSKMYCMYNI